MAPATAGPPPIPFHTALEADWLQARRTAQPSRRRFSELASAYDPQRGAKPRARDPARVAEFERLHAPLAKARVRRLSDWSALSNFLPPSLDSSGYGACRVYGKTLRKLSRGTSIKPTEQIMAFV